MSYNYERLVEQLISNEGLRLIPYRDTMGHLTIGVGHLMGRYENFIALTRDQALDLLSVDIGIAERRLTNIFPQWRSLDEVRQRAMIDLTFNLGYKLADFKRFLHAAKSGDWDKAADQLMQSRWYRQVRLRGPRVVQAIRTGVEVETK
jgi:lysozyme